MSDLSMAERTVKMREFICAEHFRYRRAAVRPPLEGEFELKRGMALVVTEAKTPMLERAMEDFGTFCRQCLGVELAPASFGDRSATGDIVFSLKGGNAPAADALDPQREAFRIDVCGRGIAVWADHERGLLHATHYLERLMADCGQPYLEKRRHALRPQFTPRLTNSMFIVSDQDAGDAAPFNDDYLSLMSHFGANGIHLHMNFWEYCRNGVLPELNSPDFDARAERLNALNARLLRHGLDAWPVFIARSLPANHAVFRDPKRRGAPFKIMMSDVLDAPTQYVLCSGNEEVLAAYEDMMVNLFTACPDLAGGWFIVGGEGFLHCYTRPHGLVAGYTSCPHCRDHAPSLPIARLCNRLAAGIKRTGRHKAFLAHPYSAFTWSGEDRAQVEWLGHLSGDVAVISNFDTGSVDMRNGAGVVLYDYNIKSTGPSACFAEQAKALSGRGRRIYAKIESNTTADFFSLPYIPVHLRWFDRYREMRRLKVAGYAGQWRFYGMNGSLPEEIQYHAIWNPERDGEDLLAMIARRDFALDEKAANVAVAGWRKMSAAWDDYPYSAMTAGEREFYMRGPMHYGPAHPLVFNVQDRYRLSPQFSALREDLFEGGTPANLDELLRNAKPRYVSELLLVFPYGVKRYLELTGLCRRQWAEGLALLTQALGSKPTARAQMELDICEMTDIHLTTLENVVRFYEARDSLEREFNDRSGFAERIETLKTIVRAEIANAERSLPILARDLRPGYGHCYGPAYDAEMVREKLRQCRYVLETELPFFDKTMRFHIWNEFFSIKTT